MLISALAEALPLSLSLSLPLHRISDQGQRQVNNKTASANPIPCQGERDDVDVRH